MLNAAISSKKSVLLFHALSDVTRLALLDQLSVGERCVCELTDAMRAGQSRLSFHLKVLKEAGFITDRRDGRWMYYSINREAIEDLEEIVERLKRAAKGEGTANRCC